MNLIGAVLAIGLVVVIYSVFSSPEKPESVPVAVESAEQKQYVLLEVPPEPVKVVAPQVTFGGSIRVNEAVPAKRLDRSKPTVSERCRFDSLDLSGDFTVYAGRAVGKRIGYQINGQGRLASQVDVTVNQTSRPSVLMLDTPVPTIWNIKRTVGTEIMAIFFNGANTQVLAGIDDTIPIFANTQENAYPCGRFKIDIDNTRVLDSVAEAMFGVDTVALSSESHNQLRFGAPVNYTHRYITDGVSPESYRDPKLPPPGKEGIAQALRKGQIRLASRSDIDKWIQSALRHGYSKDKIEEMQDVFRHNSYLVVREFTFPPALTGSSRANFFVNYGVPMPIGDPGQSDVYDMNTGTCQGTVCRVLLMSQW